MPKFPQVVLFYLFLYLVITVLIPAQCISFQPFPTTLEIEN